MNKLIKLTALLVAGLLLVTGCGTKPASTTKVESAPYKHDDLLVSVDWLKANKDNVLLIDARSEKEYQAGHIPGAVNTQWQMYAQIDKGKPGDKGWGTLKEPKDLSRVFSQVGIDGKKEIIVYTDPNAWGEDGRIVWMLRSAGLNNSKMLNGGWTAWQASKGEVSKEPVKPTATSYTVAHLDSDFNATTEWILANKDKVKIVDVRTKKEYDGATDYGEVRGGHLPGAININFKDLFADDSTIKAQAEIEALFAQHGIKPDDELVFYCTKGIRSAHSALIARMAGFDKARNYDASFHEWAGDKSLTLE